MTLAWEEQGQRGHPQSLAQVMGKMWCHLQRWGAGSGEDGDLTFRPAGFETHKWKHLLAVHAWIRGSIERSGMEIELWELSV